MLLNLMISFSSSGLNFLICCHCCSSRNGLHRVPLRYDWLDEASGRVFRTGLGFNRCVIVGRINAKGGFAVERNVGQLHDEFGKLVADKVPEGPHGNFGIITGNLEYADDGIRQVRVVRGFEHAGAQ